MTREELEQAIKKGESVWGILETNELIEIVPSKIKVYDKKSFFYGEDYFMFMEDVYKTKAEAEHYLHHANISRTEQLPFLTWEEFNKDTLGFDFTDNIGNKYRCHIVRDYRGGEDFIVLYDKNGTISVDEEWEATEENFYKAYDECVRLFKGGG